MSWSVGDYDWNDLELVAARRREDRRTEVRCQVEGCDADMQELRPFYQRLRICEAHAKAHSITDASGRVMRFCQQCSKLQPLEMFTGGHRSCTESLDKRRARRTLASAVRRKAATSDTEEEEEEGEEEEEEEAARQPKRRATKQGSASATGSAGSSGEQSVLPSTLVSKFGPRSRGSPSTRVRGAYRRRGSDDSGAAAAPTGGSAGPAAREGVIGSSPDVSAVRFGGMSAEALAPAAAQLPPLGLPFSAAGATFGAEAMLPQPLNSAAAQHQPANWGGHGSGALFDLSALPAPGAAAPLSRPLELPSAPAPRLPDDDEIDLLLQLSPEELADVLLADCDSHAGLSRLGGGQPLTSSALNPCSWPLPPMAATGPVLSHAAAPAANTAVGGSLAPVAQPHGTDDSRASVSRRPEEVLPACHMHPHAAGSNAAAWAVPQPDQAQPALPGWPGLLGADQLVTLCIKLFGTTPDDLPADLHAQLQMAMALTPTVLQASLRHGCLCLTVSALLSPVELERLQREHPSGLAASVAGAVAKAQAASGTPDDARKLLVQAGSQLAAADAQRSVIAAQPLPTSPGSMAGRLLAAPRLVTPPVLCSGGSRQPIQLVLVGHGLADSHVALHCRSRGQHQVVTVQRVWRSPAAAGSLQEPSTPPPADRHSAADSGFDSESEDGGAWAPNATGPAAAASSDGPTAAEAAFEAVSLAPGEDALLVQVAAPAQSWGLFELEVSAGSLLSRAVPLLVLPAAAEAAAKELAAGLAGLPPSEAASLLLHLGFAMQAAEQGARLQPAAVQRVSRLACALALFCGERGWVSAARLLLPAIALAAQPAEGSRHSTLRVAASCKDDLPGCSAAAAAAGLRACKGVAPDQQERLSLMLARMAAKDAEDAEDAEAAQQQQQQAPAQLVSPLSDWFWVGCNLAAGAAAVVLLVRNLAMEGMP